MTFYGESHVDHHTEQHIHESPRSMTVPLMFWRLIGGGRLGGHSGMAWRSNIIEHGWNRFSSPFPIAVEAARATHFGQGVEREWRQVPLQLLW